MRLNFIFFCLLFFSKAYSQQHLMLVGDPVSISEKNTIIPKDTLYTLLPVSTSPDEVLIPYRKGAKWGFCDTMKNIIIPPAYDEIELDRYSYDEGDNFLSCDCVPDREHKIYGLHVVVSKGKYGIINKFGEVMQPKYQRLTFSAENFIVENTEQGKPNKLFNLKGQLLLDSIIQVSELYQKSGIKNQYLFEATGNGRKGIFLYDIESQQIIKWVLSDKKYFRTTSCGHNKNVVYKWAADGNHLLGFSIKFDPVTLNAELLPVTEKEENAILGLNKLQSVVSKDFKAPKQLGDSLVSIEYKLKVTDKSIKVISKQKGYSSLSGLNRSDTSVVILECDSLKNTLFYPDDFVTWEGERQNGKFSYRNYCICYKDGKQGLFIGKNFIRPEFDLVEYTNCGRIHPLFKVKKGGKSGVIDATGAYIIELQYDSIRPGYFFITGKNGLYGFTDQYGKEIGALDYQQITPLRYGSLLLEKDAKYGYYHDFSGFIKPIFNRKFASVQIVKLGNYKVYQLFNDEKTIGFTSLQGFEFFDE